jgi:hypothetical protein
VNPTVYIETSVISYRAARPSRDLIVAAHQQMTHEWWNRVLPQCDAFVFPVVLEEIGQGDPDAVQRRLRDALVAWCAPIRLAIMLASIVLLCIPNFFCEGEGVLMSLKYPWTMPPSLFWALCLAASPMSASPAYHSVSLLIVSCIYIVHTIIPAAITLLGMRITAKRESDAGSRCRRHSVCN